MDNSPKYKFEDGEIVILRRLRERGEVMDRKTEFDGSNSYLVKWQGDDSANWYTESALTTD